MLFSNYLRISPLSTRPHRRHCLAGLRNCESYTSRLYGFPASGNKLRPSSMVSVGNFGLDFQTSVVWADPGNTACSSRRLPVCIKEQLCEGFVGCRVLYEVHSVMCVCHV